MTILSVGALPGGVFCRCLLLFTGCAVAAGVLAKTVAEASAAETRIVETAVPEPVPAAVLSVAGSKSGSPVRVIGMVLYGLENPAYQKLEENARQFCRSSGRCRLLSGGALSVQDEAAQRIWFKQLLAEKVDGLVVAPSGGQKLVAQLVRAKKKGIQVVSIGCRFNPELLARNRLLIPWVGPDNGAAARALAQLLVDRLPAGAKVAILAGPPGHQASYERVKAARNWLKSHKLKVVAVEAAHWQPDRAEASVRALLGKIPDLDAIMAMSDGMARGALRAVDLVKPGRVLVTGFDGDDQVLNLIRSGKMLATVDWYPDRQGIYGIKKLLASTSGDMSTPWRLLIREDLVADKVSAGRGD